MAFAWPKTQTMKIPLVPMMPNALAHKFVTSVSVKSLKVLVVPVQAKVLLMAIQTAAQRAVEVVMKTALAKGVEV